MMKQLEYRFASRRILTSPLFSAVLDISRINLKSRSELRCKTEGTILKTDNGTCTTEDEFQLNNLDLWSIFNQRDLQFTQSPIDIRLLHYGENEITLNFIDFKNGELNKNYGTIDKEGQLKFTLRQSNVLKQSKLLYITFKSTQKCVYLCIIQGMSSVQEVINNFKNFIIQLWHCQSRRLCAACYFEITHILVWDYVKQSTWILYGYNLELFHNRQCVNRNRKIRKQIYSNNENSNKSTINQQYYFQRPKLIIEDQMNNVLDFIKPSVLERDRINEVVTQIQCRQKKEYQFNKQDIHTKIIVIKQYNQQQFYQIIMISLPSFIKHQFGIPEKLLKKRTKMIIDTDSGGDDIHALLTAFDLAQRQNIDIIGITCITGNSLIEDGIKNISIVQKIAGVNIPIYKGCDRNLKQQITLSSRFFGDDGISGHQAKLLQQFNITQFPVQQQHAVDFLIDSAIKYKDDLIVICLGALTNIACAMMKAEDFETNVGLLISLSGNILGLGFMNNGVAEYNVHTDPEAAHLVFKVLANKLVVIPYEGVISVSEFTITKVFEQDNTVKGKFIREIYEGMKNTNNRYDIQDPLCILVATKPDIITEYVDKPCVIILEGEGRGMLSVKWLEKNPQNCVTFILKVNENQLIQSLSEVVN